MSLMTNNCEIVDNVACGQSFQYCRTHKVEPKDCPGNAKPVGIESLNALAEQTRLINKLAASICPSPLKREFKVGDKVRVLVDNPYSSGFTVGQVLTVRSAHFAGPKLGWDLYFEGTHASIYSTDYDDSLIVEHV